MESGSNPVIPEKNDIDLSNYIRDPNSRNPVVYLHKRNFKRFKNNEDKRDGHKMQHKGQQYDFDKMYDEMYNVSIVKEKNKDPVMEHTVQFAKNLIPITIARNTEDSKTPVCYTIKTSKSVVQPKNRNSNVKHIKKDVINKESAIKDKCKKTKIKNDQDSSSESVSQTSQTTLNDTNNQILSCTLSDVSDRKVKKRDRSYLKTSELKLESSGSFQAMAAECANESKIKIQLMNKKERNILYEKISSPLVKSVKECVSQIIQNEAFDMQSVRESIENNSKKLNNILDRLNNIEKRLNITDIDDVETEAKGKRMKVTKIQERGEEFTNIKKNSSFEKEMAVINHRKIRQETGDPVVTLHDMEDVSDNLDQSENFSNDNRTSSLQGIKPAPSNRIPARFCWTNNK